MPGALDDAIDQLWEVFGDRHGLVAALAGDACLARARAGELASMLPRLCEIVIAERDADLAVEVFDLCHAADWRRWPSSERITVERFADTWWEQTRSDHGPVPSADDVLAALTHLRVPLVRFLQPWLDDLDGPAARHLADAVLQRFSSPRWAGCEDERSQVEGWTRTEPVILGITTVGGIHLDEGVLGDVLDRLL